MNNEMNNNSNEMNNSTNNNQTTNTYSEVQTENNQPEQPINLNNNIKPNTKNNNNIVIITIIIIVILLLLTIVSKVLIINKSVSTVKNSMDKARLSSIESTSILLANTISTNISEESILKDGDLSNFYSNYFSKGKGYNLDTFNGKKIAIDNPAIYYLSSDLSSSLVISTKLYDLSDKADLKINNGSQVDSSFFTYDKNIINVCLVVNNQSDYYSDSAALKENKTIQLESDITITFKKGIMFSCSNKQKSWE